MSADRLLTVWRYYAVFTASPFVIQAGEHHSDRAIIEQALAD